MCGRCELCECQKELPARQVSMGDLGIVSVQQRHENFLHGLQFDQDKANEFGRRMFMIFLRMQQTDGYIVVATEHFKEVCVLLVGAKEQYPGVFVSASGEDIFVKVKTIDERYEEII